MTYDSSMIPFSFHKSVPGGPAPMDEAELDRPVPLQLGADTGHGFSFREYFHAIRDVLLDNIAMVKEAATRKIGHGPAAVRDILIVSEKHGSDYHPARVVLRCEEVECSFVMNTALTERGLSRIRAEYETLRSLGGKNPSFIPAAYFLADRSSVSGNGPVDWAMFFGDWFDGFHEFHVTPHSSPGWSLTLWDMKSGPALLCHEECMEILREASYILTHYYHPLSFEEIYPWHHAAGDFVAARSSFGMKVKLVAARQYAGHVVFSGDDPAYVVEALLLFFANLSLRMRLDRVDGVGDPVWIAFPCAQAIIEGFIRGVREKTESVMGGQLTLFQAFYAFVRTMGPRDWASVFRMIFESYDPEAPDTPVVEEHLADHILDVYHIMKDPAVWAVGPACSSRWGMC
jgi:hypothetical protein